ncbi:MAG: serine protease [Akkermansiaceae bacterium]
MIRLTLLASLVSTICLSAKPIIIDDREIAKSLSETISKYAEAEEGPSADELRKQLESAPSKLDEPIQQSDSDGTPNESVYLISSAYNCGKCSKWHLGGIATAWALTTDGLMVTNFHVIEKAKGAAMAVTGVDGNVHRIEKILAADKPNDIAIFKVDAKNLKPLRLSKPAPIGEKVEVISNPDSRFFTHTFGHVSRYHRKRSNKEKDGPYLMSITADYAKGSSGGPVLGSNQQVVGMVTSTQSIYYKSSRGAEPKGPLQMVVKNCVPVSAISAMLNTSSKASD